MNRENLIRMAWQAYDDPTYGFDQKELDDLERFAALVAAHEREACAKVCDARRASVRWRSSEDIEARACAAAIRARGGEQ